MIGELSEIPSGTSFISLRASAQDADGNAVEQEVVRAVGRGLTRDPGQPAEVVVFRPRPPPG